MQDSASGKKILLPGPALAGIAIIITLAFWLVVPRGQAQVEYTDFSSYYEPIARNLVAGNGYVDANDSIPTANPPGFALTVAGIYKVAVYLGITEETALTLATLLSVAAISILQFRIAGELGSGQEALVGFLLLMTYLPFLWLTRAFHSELPFMAILYAAIYVFLIAHRREHLSMPLYFLVGLLIGLALLFRSIAIGLSCLLALLVLLQRSGEAWPTRLRLGSAILAGAALAILPWEVWLYRNTGEFILVGTNGLPSIRDGLTFAVDYGNKQRTDFAVPNSVRTVMQAFYASSVAGQMDSIGGLVRTVGQQLEVRPFASLTLFLMKLARSWFGTDSGRLEGALAVMQVPYLALGLLGSARAWRRQAGKRWIVVLLWMIIGYFWLMTTLVLSIVRYMIPAIGLLHVIAAIPLTACCSKEAANPPSVSLSGPRAQGSVREGDSL